VPQITDLPTRGTQMRVDVDVYGGSHRLSTAEAVAVAMLAAPVSAVLAAYLIDLSGLRFSPWSMLVLVAVAVTVAFAWFHRGATPIPQVTALYAFTTLATGVWLVWLAYPTLLPLSTGPDLTHHLLLIRYVEVHWRLVHDPAVERLLGEMSQYTPGSHILAALAGAWSGTDGLRALHTVQALTVALKAGFLLLIGVRLLPSRAPRPLAALGVVLLFGAPRYFVGSFTEFAFVAQVVAELFVIAMWWVAVAWDASPDYRLDVVFSLAGAAAFLTWPVYSGPPALAFCLVIALRSDRPLLSRARHLLVAFGPFTACALIYLVGRFGWLQLAGTGGSAPWPSIAAYGAALVVLGTLGFAMSLVRRRARSTMLFTVAVLGAAAAFFVLATRAGAPQPYMALKMGYLLLWPMAACAVLAVGEIWQRVWQGSVNERSASLQRIERSAAVAVVVVSLVLMVVPLASAPSRLHPLPPAVSAPLYDAGRWARDHLPAGCIEYLVGDDETAYWLHLAVLGNPRMSDRTGNNATYEPDDAVIRWLTANGLPFGIADLTSLPRDVRDELDVVQRFDTAAVVRRRGASSCAEAP
jgi:hypothetical protein